MREIKNITTFACISGIIAVMLGAFGAHALESVLTPDQLESYRTAVFYQFIHTLAIIAVIILHIITSKIVFKRAAVLFAFGVIFFSGSIYLLSTQSLTGLNLSILGPITPIGGLLFIIGWTTAAWGIRKL